MIEKLNNTLINNKVKSVYSFNDYSLQDLLSSFFEKINECIDISNTSLDFINYLKNEGLPKEVIKELELMYNDGRLTQIIDTLSGNLNQEIIKIKNEFIPNYEIDGGIW